MTSNEIILSAPMSFVGSAQRIWRMSSNGFVRWLLLLPILLLVWCVVCCWYAVFGLWLAPYRLVRRSMRKGKRNKLQHQEILTALQTQHVRH